MYQELRLHGARGHTHRRPSSHERDDAVCKRRTPMRFSLIAAVLPALFICNVALAQVGTATPIPTIGETSPLGIATGSASSPTAILNRPRAV
jgi:hypothetical protein